VHTALAPEATCYLGFFSALTKECRSGMTECRTVNTGKEGKTALEKASSFTGVGHPLDHRRKNFKFSFLWYTKIIH